MLSLEEVADLMDHSTLIDDSLSSLALSHAAREETPPLPLKQGHIALQLACGQFNGAVGTGDHATSPRAGWYGPRSPERRSTITATP